jgi:hypothetical protein
MKRYFTAKIFLMSLLLGATVIEAQMAPKSDHTGKTVSMIRSDASTPVSIEYRSENQWQQMRLEPGKDATVPGDRIRVATRREDQAIITVDLPIEGGKKYRLIWNAQASMWDFSPAS